MNSLPSLALLLLPLVPLAADPGPAGPGQQDVDPARRFDRLLRKFDRNGDKRISSDEFTLSSRAFRRFDKDRNGFIDLDDFEGGAEAGTDMQEALQPMSDEASLLFFEKSIRPVLEASCFRCHSTKGEKVKGGLLLDSRELILAGGDSGPAIVPGAPESSLLLTAISYTDEDLEMPPKRPLADNVVQDFERWIEMGAPWPAQPALDQPTLGEHGIDFESARQWWSYQSPQAATPPAVENESWPWGAVDQFLLAAMEEQNLRPVPDAEDIAWLRRVSLDLAGLPPTPQEFEAFSQDKTEQRYEKVVDQLLGSPRFGERWGRHWLDVARYAESSGRDANIVYPHAWRYRDYVIEAFDRDLPYDQFLAQQIAGDLMPAEHPTQRAQLDIATGYLALGSKSHTTRDPRQFATDLVDEQVDALTQGMLGVTVSCARCHDHKFDPIPTEDYYALAGVFRSSQALYGTFQGQRNRYPTDLIELPLEADISNGTPMPDTFLRFAKEQQERLSGEVANPSGASRRERRARADEMQSEESMQGESMKMGADKEEDTRRRRQVERANKDSLAAINDLFVRFDENGQPTSANRVAMGMRDAIASDMPLLIRGEIDAVGPLVPRGVPQILSPGGIEIPEGTSGRLQVGEWVASADNPLTARVWVNRIWLHLFGAGLVSTPDNFGMSGQTPSHPQLLDWLAVNFMEQDGWSTKSMIRRLVLTHAYRLGATENKQNHRIDPNVVALWRMPERRLDAEVIRDSMLAVSGKLDLERPGGAVVNVLEGEQRRDRVFQYLDNPKAHRSVYLSLLRDRVPDSMEVFDVADPTFVTGDRRETSVATQALYLMNDPEVMELADAFAQRILAHSADSKQRIEHAFLLALGRQPSASEVRAVKSFIKEYARMPHPQDNSYDRKRSRKSRSDEDRAQQATREVWSAFVQTLFQSAEFRYAG